MSDSLPGSVNGDRTMCARCRKRKRASLMTGCLCWPCEETIEGMSQAELDADYEKHKEVA